MGSKWYDIRIKLDDEDMEKLRELKRETGIKSNAELIRFALTRLHRYISQLSNAESQDVQE